MKTECVNGHPFDAANTRVSAGRGRACRACERDRYHARRARQGKSRQLNLTVVERFMPRVFMAPSGCWIWLGHLDADGYGRFSEAKTRPVMAHRWSYTHRVGPIPDGLHLDHLCRVRRCVNPIHLQPVTPDENNRRSASPSARNARKTHCPEGHEYSVENTYASPDGGRHCRTCGRDRARRRSAMGCAA